MISLRKLLLESKNQPLAIFMGGSAAAGKTTFRQKYIDRIGKFTVLNIDDEYEPLLSKANLPLDFRKFKGSEDLSTAAKQMAAAQTVILQKYSDLKTRLQNIIIDGTGASSREVLKKKKELEDLGYKTMMIIIVVSPDISLQRNINRGDQGGRTLMPAIILKSWSSLVDNINIYRQAFGENLIVYKGYKEEHVKFKDFDPNDAAVKKTFFDPFKVKGKTKSPEERAKANKKIADMNAKIKSQMSKLKDIEFDDINSIQSKITNFVNA